EATGAVRRSARAACRRCAPARAGGVNGRACVCQRRCRGTLDVARSRRSGPNRNARRAGTQVAFGAVAEHPMQTLLLRLVRETDGQNLAEYGIALAVVAVGAAASA